MTEVSGIVASRAHPGVFWVHEDSGHGAELHAVSDQGADLGTFTVDGATNRDWEDITAADDALYIGDIGDNRGVRPTVTVYRVDEPATVGQDGHVGVSATHTLRYPGGPSDAEALFVDPTGGDLYVLTKNWDGDGSRILRATEAALAAGGTVTMVDEGKVRLDVGTIAFPGDSVVTAADITPTGDEIYVRSYGRVFVFRRGRGESVAGALQRRACRGDTASEGQGEAIAVTDRGYVTIAEGADPVLHAFDRRPDPAPTAIGRDRPSRLPVVAAVVGTVVLLLGSLWLRRRMGDSTRASDRQG